jgi:cytochrome c peroxidase
MKWLHRRFVLKLSVAGALFGALAGVLGLPGCGGGGVSVTDTLASVPSASWRWALPAGFPVPAVPVDNPMNEAKVDLE